MANTIHEEFLDFCCIDGDLRKKTLPDWKRACEILQIPDEELRWSLDHWLPENYDLRYKGIRMGMGAWLLEAIDITRLHDYKKNGVKLVYGIIPSNTATYYGIKKAGGDKVAVMFPDLAMMIFNQAFFGRGGKYFEIAEQAGMTYGARHCALNKMRIGIRLADVIPTPDVDWAWGTVCDEATKIDEYITSLYDEKWKTVVTRLPHDTARHEKQWEMDNRVKYFAQQLRLSMREVEDIIGFKVTDEHVAMGMQELGKVLQVVGKTNALIDAANPKPIRNGSLSFVTGPFACPFNTGIDFTLEANKVLCSELEQAIAEGHGAYPKDAPKVDFYFMPWALPWVDKIFQENGVLAGISMNAATSSIQMQPSKYTDPYEKTSEAWLKRVYSMGCQPEIDDWVEKIERDKPDGFIAGFLDYDRWIGTLHKKMLQEVEARTGVPCFYIEGDFYDGRDYNEEALRTRIESICQIVKARKREKMNQA